MSTSLHEYIPPYMGTKYEKHFSNYEGHLMNPHLYTDKPVSQKLFEEFLSERKNQVEELEEFKKCINAINTSDVVLKNRKKLAEIWGNQFDINYDYFFSLIWKVIKSSYEKDSFDESKFIKEYGKLRDFFYNENTAQVQILVPLHNLECNFGNIDLSDLIESRGGLVLRPITDEDKTFLITVMGGYESERTISIHSSDFMLELEYYDKFYSEGEIKAQSS
jgi:hypothetical protein